MDLIDWIIILGLISVLLLGMGIGRYLDKKQWNNGICKESNLPWKCFDIDSQGGRGYKDGAGHYLWISYNVDKIKEN